MECYSHYNPRREQCSQCDLTRYCRESADPPMLSERSCGIPVDILGETLPMPKPETEEEQGCYTREEMIELIGFLVALDDNTLQVLGEKLQNPRISLAAVAVKKGITRQAMHKLVKQRCEQVPELSIILQNRKHKKTKTFMEAVCQIQKQTQDRKSKKPVPNSNSSNSLTSLNRSLDLSRMSIGKGIRS